MPRRLVSRRAHPGLYQYRSAGCTAGGAIKNVIAIAAGISDGLGFGANTRAALITRAWRG
ncbi:MAG: hypothetical protein CM1200mP20_16520 [Pseudomonadota bacterium]|nr:MAG: hypothetical protein CM1200mP20_16520 [Pseudomonadota bacterium]